MNTVIVPMKGHSERCPGKNIRMLKGKPLFWWLLTASDNADAVDSIVVDTDSTHIAKAVNTFAAKYMWTKVRVSLRPEEYCGDAVGGNKLLERFITPVGCFMQAHVTSPFLKHTTINKAFEELSNLKNGCVFSVTQIQQRVYTHDYSPINFDVEGPIKRTQDLDPVYHENGAFFAFHGEAYLANGNRRNPTDSVPSVMLPLEFPETVDIDTEEDFSLAEAIIKGGIHDR